MQIERILEEEEKEKEKELEDEDIGEKVIKNEKLLVRKIQISLQKLLK